MDVATGAALAGPVAAHPTDTSHITSILGIVYTPDGGYLLTAGTDGRLAVLDGQSLEVLDDLATSASGGSLNGVAASPDGSAVAVAEADGDVAVYEWPGGRERFGSPR